MMNKSPNLLAAGAFDSADLAWHEELCATYGKAAAGARYDRSLNAATPRLAELRDARGTAQKAWESLAFGGRP